jgi:hypothetical protein
MRHFSTSRGTRTLSRLAYLSASVLGAAAIAGASPSAGAVTAGRAASGHAAGSAWQDPPVNGQFDYQIGGSYQPAAGVRIVDRDRTSKPVSGLYNVCYVNAFQTQAYQDGWWKAHHPSLLLRRNGKAVHDPGWPGEIILDTSTGSKRHRLLAVIGGWIDGCADKGFDAVEPDNLDSNTRSHHLLTQSDDMDFAALLAQRAHDDGLAFGQKNDAELGKAARDQVGFDFAIAEECQVYSECHYYTRDYGSRVIEIEYTDNGRSYYNQACAARGAQISVILRDRDVVPKGHSGYVYQSC